MHSKCTEADKDHHEPGERERQAESQIGMHLFQHLLVYRQINSDPGCNMQRMPILLHTKNKRKRS